MYPNLFSYGPFRIYTYGFFLALAFLCSMYMAGREAKRRGGRVEQIYDLSFYSIVAAIIGSRLLDVILKWDYFSAHPLEIFMIMEGWPGFSRRSHFWPAYHPVLYLSPSDGFMDYFGYHGCGDTPGSIYRSVRLFYGRLLLRPGMSPSLGRHLQ